MNSLAVVCGLLLLCGVSVHAQCQASDWDVSCSGDWTAAGYGITEIDMDVDRCSESVSFTIQYEADYSSSQFTITKSLSGDVNIPILDEVGTGIALSLDNITIGAASISFDVSVAVTVAYQTILSAPIDSVSLGNEDTDVCDLPWSQQCLKEKPLCIWNNYRLYTLLAAGGLLLLIILTTVACCVCCCRRRRHHAHGYQMINTTDYQDHHHHGHHGRHHHH
eukprot:TRINITY_DN7269_c0_g1_i1.p1 TRINITY_DN7269_c0_g1~~TRINITY_DN7269_c0_g1_i1.p1  ORF type:complete len:221 (+),score=35.35 TRINITY_DN7269_c0_g1_i1:190-852(+)